MSQEVFIQQLRMVRDFVRVNPYYSTCPESRDEEVLAEITCMALGFLARGWGDGSPIACCLWEAASKLSIGNPEAAIKQMDNVLGILET